MSEERDLTEGEYRVGIKFNVSGDPAVDNIKARTAALIDEMIALAGNPVGTNPGAARCAAIAATEFESAAMWAVKAVTKPVTQKQARQTQAALDAKAAEQERRKQEAESNPKE